MKRVMNQQLGLLNDLDFATIAKRWLKLILCTGIKFCYGFLFGSLMWAIILEPYGKYLTWLPLSISSKLNSYWLEFSFSLIVAILFMTFLWFRCIMVLFLPTMLSNASQNYVILLLFIGLLANPVANVSLNAVESVRVIGCTLTMTFEQLKERAKLIIAPVTEILSDKDDVDLNLVKKDLLDIQQIALDIKREAEFSAVEALATGASTSNETSSKIKQAPDKNVVTMSPERQKQGDLKSKLIAIASNQTNLTNLLATPQQLVENAKFVYDGDQFAVKADVDIDAFRRLLKANFSRSGIPLTGLNLTEIMRLNCLSVFERAKSTCGESVDKMRQSCHDSLGPIFATLWCSPLSFGIKQFCPWIMNQLVDEKGLCNQIHDKFKRRNQTGGNIDHVYANFTNQLLDVSDILIDDRQQNETSKQPPQRLEINISLNNQTSSVVFKTYQFFNFVADKYRMRRLFYDILLFLYELYTTFTFLLLLYQARNYALNYRKSVRFDNYYITGLFKKIDSKRKLQGKPSVLPLTKEESLNYITTFTCKRRTVEERKTQRADCLITILFLVFAFSLIYFDYIIASILNSIRQHSLINFHEVGQHVVDIKVDGATLAKLIRKLVERLNSSYNLNRFSSTRDCLPQPKQTGYMFYVEFSSLVLIFIGIDQISIYAMRFRRLTAAFFYPGKEKQRVVFLYNSILMQRRRLEQAGLRSYIDPTGEDETAAVAMQKRNDESVYTVRDALAYIQSCVSKSLCCSRHRAIKG